MLWAKRNAGKDDRKPPPINSHIEHESENPRSLKNWCRVVCEISCKVQILARIRAFRLSRILIGRESQLCTGRIVKTDVDASFYCVFLKPHDIRAEERTQDSRERPALSERSSVGPEHSGRSEYLEDVAGSNPAVPTLHFQLKRI